MSRGENLCEYCGKWCSDEQIMWRDGGGASNICQNCYYELHPDEDDDYYEEDDDDYYE